MLQIIILSVKSFVFKIPKQNDRYAPGKSVKNKADALFERRTFAR